MSSKVPVVLDIHADWCGPCKTLAPVLEAAVRSQGGAVSLAKLDADANGNLVQQLRVTSLPTVLGVHQGKLVDSFTGMQPEDQVNAFVKRLAALGGAPEESPVDVARSALDKLWLVLSSGDVGELDLEQMADLLRGLAQFEAEGEAEAGREVRARATALTAKLAMVAGDVGEAKEIAAKIEADFKDLAGSHGEIRKVLAEVKLAGDGAEDTGEAKELSLALEKDAKDPAALLGLARVKVAAGEHEEAVELALKLLRVNRGFEDSAAQKLLIDVFEALGPVSGKLVGCGLRVFGDGLMFRSMS